MIRIVFDTNVVISAMIFVSSMPRRAIELALLKGTILISAALSEEMNRVIVQDRFDRYVSRRQREGFLELLIRESKHIEITESIQVCRDPKDDRVLELAVCGNAAYIVTGDADLLVLNPFRGIGVLRPADFLELPI